jgi:16S rRNA (uracil1498-N3)-methyltransferase
LTAVAPAEIEAPPRVAITLAAAWTKAGLDDVVAAVTELGVAGVIPLRTERTIVRRDAARAERVGVRLATVAREAAMQSRRVRIPAIHPEADLASIVDRPGLIVADHTGDPAPSLDLPATPSWTVVVGPEGGFSDAELDAFGKVPRLSIGPHVVRATTAPVAAVAVLAARAED